MFRKLLFLFLIGFFSLTLCGQKNRYESFFKELDSMSNSELVFNKLILFKSSKKLNDIELVAYYKQRIRTAIKIQKYDDALKTSNDGLILSRKVKSDSLEAFFNEKVGVAHYHIGQKDMAEIYFKKSLELSEKYRYYELIAKSSSNLGALNIEKKNFEKAEFYLKKSLFYHDKNKTNPSETIIPNRLLATLYSETKRYDLAEPIYFKVLKTSENIKDTNLICFSHVYYARLLEMKGEMKFSLEHLEEALKLAKLLKNKNTLEVCMVNLSRGYLEAKQYEKSARLFRETYLLSKKVFQENLRNSVAETEVKYKTAEIKHQKAIAEAKALSEHRKNELYIFIFAGIVLLLIIGFLIIYLRLQNKRKKIELALKKQQLEAVLEAQEEEKVRIARDLHDGICQKFAATKMRFSAISDQLLDNIPDIKVNYKNCISLLDEATNELRSIAHEIMPPALNELGLVEALRHLTQQTFGQHLEFSFEVFGEKQSFSQNEEINIYRIAQELFANVIKHAKATEVAIQVIFSKKQFSLFVEDNGLGFLPNEKLGMGLGNIQLRTDLISAKFNIEPGATRGTFASIIKEKTE